MPFLTDITADDVVTLECDNDGCALTKLKVKLRITKRTGNKVRLSIDADREVIITKTEEKRRKNHGSGKRRKPEII